MQRKALFHFIIPSLLLATRALASALQTDVEKSAAESSLSKQALGGSTPDQTGSPSSPLSAAAIGGWVGVAIFSAVCLLIVLTIMVRGRNTKGVPTTVRGEVSKVSGLDNDVDPYVVVSSMGEMAHRTDFRIHPGDTATFEELFTWSVSPRDIEKFKSTGKVRFEVFNLKGADYSAGDPTLGAVEIPVSELFTEGQVERVEALRLRTKKGIVINVKIGVFAEHFFFQSINRFAQYWRMRRTEVSFWTRFLSIGLVAYCMLTGLRYFDKPSHWAVGITDIVVGCVIGFNLLPHVLYWVGIHVLDRIKIDSLLSWVMLYFSCASSMITVWRFLGPSNVPEVLDHMILIGLTYFFGFLFLVGEFRNEPGASCLGSLVGSICGCCFGGSRAALLRRAL